jgi:uncharacterized OB-fold protein
MSTPLQAPLEISFDYTRSLGPVLSSFMSALATRRILGVRGSDGRVHAPAIEYDPVTFAPLSELVEVESTGTVISWSWMPNPFEGQPLAHPFAWALIQLDGADTPMLHALDVGSPDNAHTGLRVQARWSAAPVGSIHDIECFEPVSDRVDLPTAGLAEPATMVITPITLKYQHSASPEESRYLRALAEGRLVAQRCPACEKVYLPPRGACPTCGVPTRDEVELDGKGTITTFCIVNVPFPGQKTKPPYVYAAIVVDGTDIPMLHLILGCPADEVRMGMRVEAVWKPREEWGTTPQNIDHFRPADEPDAPFESYAHHL